jgi:23S rRNA (guanosine2251-2'-O)-methyltransferase
VREAIRAHGARLGRLTVEVGDSPQLEALVRFATDQGVVEIVRAAKPELDRLTHGARHQGAMVMAPDLELTPLGELGFGEQPLVLALDEIEDPQNFGAILRSAVAFDADAVVWPEHHSAPLSPATFRASAGAVEHATLCRVTQLPNALAELAARGLPVVGLDASAEQALSDIDLAKGAVLVVGAEGKGLRKPVKRACTTLAKLPMAGPLGSLNVSVAAAIGLYEVRRQGSAPRDDSSS